MNSSALEFHKLEKSRGADDDLVACVAYVSQETAETAQMWKYKQYAATQSLIWNVKTWFISYATQRTKGCI